MSGQTMNSQLLIIAIRMVEEIKKDTPFKHEAWDTKNEPWDTKNEPKTTATGLTGCQGEGLHAGE